MSYNESKYEVRERLLKQALLFAAEQYDIKAEDPGWQAEYLEEELDRAAREYIAILDTE